MTANAFAMAMAALEVNGPEGEVFELGHRELAGPRE
jgi:hypothetical protein